MTDQDDDITPEPYDDLQIISNPLPTLPVFSWGERGVGKLGGGERGRSVNLWLRIAPAMVRELCTIFDFENMYPITKP